MTADAVVDLVRLIQHAGVEVWLDGGWAVDAALGEQTRSHKDLDIILRTRDLATLRQVLAGRGFVMQEGGSESNFVLADSSGMEIDVHAIAFDEMGNGVYRMQNGTDWIFPAGGFEGRGEIQGHSVRCLTPQVQVLCHAHGYTPAKKDVDDMERLRARFGVEVPAHLRRHL